MIKKRSFGFRSFDNFRVAVLFRCGVFSSTPNQAHPKAGGTRFMPLATNQQPRSNTANAVGADGQIHALRCDSNGNLFVVIDGAQISLSTSVTFPPVQAVQTSGPQGVSQAPSTPSLRAQDRGCSAPYGAVWCSFEIARPTTRTHCRIVPPDRRQNERASDRSVLRVARTASPTDDSRQAIARGPSDPPTGTPTKGRLGPRDWVGRAPVHLRGVQRGGRFQRATEGARKSAGCGR